MDPQTATYRVTVKDRGGHYVCSYSMPTLKEAKRSGHRYDGWDVVIEGPRGGRHKLFRDERFRRPKFNWRKLRPQR